MEIFTAGVPGIGKLMLALFLPPNFYSHFDENSWYQNTTSALYSHNLFLIPLAILLILNLTIFFSFLCNSNFAFLIVYEGGLVKNMMELEFVGVISIGTCII